MIIMKAVDRVSEKVKFLATSLETMKVRPFSSYRKQHLCYS